MEVMREMWLLLEQMNENRHSTLQDKESEEHTRQKNSDRVLSQQPHAAEVWREQRETSVLAPARVQRGQRRGAVQREEIAHCCV